ncbi:MULTISPECIES: CaiB/BaiF CoA-transferase family protein [unclassified Aeromicrobium]|uniref:CaiB/BaiF CoA transferase family protein n=1 Tax=unclassified Aeromicrobium TaxID=2633570 RepID=UPI00288A441D|nr:MULTISPECIES: CaiB/BaiF CoA-transferase family protein [unclassified Aeromicrobium]
MNPLPLTGVKVLDLSTLLPGPMATLMLADAGATVVKLERPDVGDEMRTYSPRHGEASANYAILNRGKKAYAVDFKDHEQRRHVLDLAKEADIVVEQFRPGVADRLGLGFDDIKAVNDDVIYCSITGYGPNGPHATRAGHDLNYLAEAGLLNVVHDETGSPNLPVTVMADIAGGTYPAVVNILLALRHRDQTGRGAHVQVSMAHNLQVLAYGYVATHQGGNGWPTPSRELLTGGSPRYRIYRTSDGRHIACAALEQKFWDRLTELVDLEPELRSDAGREDEAAAALAARFARHDADHWRAVLQNEDVCTTVVATWEEAVQAGLVRTSGPDKVSTPDGSESFTTLWSPIDSHLREEPGVKPYPSLQPLPNDPWN